jgi:hypothetical protein
MRTKAAVLLHLAVVAMLLTACNDPDPLWGPDTPRNGAGEYITPQGLPIPD